MRRIPAVLFGLSCVVILIQAERVHGDILGRSSDMSIVLFGEESGAIRARLLSSPTGQHTDVLFPAGGFAYEQDGKWHRVTRRLDRQQSSGGLKRYHAADEEGQFMAFTIDSPFPSVIRITVVPTPHHVSRVRLDIEAHPDDHFYGMGEPWNETLDQRGKSVRMWVKTGTPDKCCFVPFYMSSRGYGLYVDEYHDGAFDFCASDPGTVRITFQNDRLVFYLIAGPEMKRILTRYCRITGFPPLPPMWSFLPWKWRNETNRDGVMEDAHKMRDLDIPVGVMMIDRPWALGPYGNNDFEFDPGRYPNAKEMIDTLNGMGMEVVVWVCEFNRSDAKNFERGLKIGAYCDGPRERATTDPDRVGSYHIDFRNPRGYEFWKTEMQKVVRQGIAGFKLDRGQSIGDKARYANGESGREMHNYHGYLFNQCCFEALAEIRGNDFTMLPRAGWAGSQKFAMAKWPGDMSASFHNYSGLPAVVLNQQTIGLSGFPFYGSDIGGFSRGASVPVFARWVEHGALSPIMQCPHQPWEYGEEMVRIYRKYAKLHTQLVPYIYHYAQVAHETGIPITRALVLEFQGDEEVSNLWSEYMFGESVLVAPVIGEQNRREIYLPEGTWFDFWTGELYRGPVRLPDEEELPLDVLPLFVRGGAILPMTVEDGVTGHGGTFSRDAITLDAYPAVSVDWEKEYSLLDTPVMTSTQGGDKRFKVRCSAAPTRVVMRVLTPEPVRVLDGGRPLARENSTHDGTWFYDDEAGRAYVVLEAKRPHEVALIVD